MSITTDTDDSDRLKLDTYRTEIDGENAIGLTIADDTRTAWLETTHPVQLGDWE